jgi:SAM-dependent methyltransferase
MASGAKSPSCLLCGSEAFDVIEMFPDPKEHVAAYYVCRCGLCRFLYTYPQPSREIIGQYYEQDYSSWHLTTKRGAFFDSSWQQWTYCHHFGYRNFCNHISVLKRAVASVMSYFHSQIVTVPRGDNLGKLLDVGCGSGQFLALMTHLGWDVLGVEPDSSACRMAAERWGIVPINGWIEDVAERDFDLVSMIGVIEHLYDPVDTLRKIRGLLKPGGKVFVTTHDISGPGPRLFGKHWVGWEVPQHLYFFDQNSMMAALNKAGFKRVKFNRHFRSIDLFNTTKIGQRERYTVFLFSRLFVALGLSGGMVVEAEG